MAQSLAGHQQRGEEGYEGANVGMPGIGPPALIGQDSGDHDHHQGFRDRGGRRAGVVAADQMTLPLGDHGGHAGLLIGLAILHLHHPNAIESFHDGGGKGAGGLHGPASRLGGATQIAAQKCGHHRRGQKNEESEFPVLDRHDHAGRHQGQALLDEVHQTARGRLANETGVIQDR